MKGKRLCSCGSVNPTIYPMCDPCRQKGCLHTEFHYGGNFAKICNQCGIAISAPTNKSNKNLKRGQLYVYAPAKPLL